MIYRNNTPQATSQNTFIGIHTRDERMEVLYISSGCLHATGHTASSVVNKQVKDFIADAYDPNDYMGIYGSEENEDEASVYVWYANLYSASGSPVLHRMTSFKCDSCVICIAHAMPDAPHYTQGELKVQMLDGAMKDINVTRKRRSQHGKTHRQRQPPRQAAHNNQAKAAFVLENINRGNVAIGAETDSRPTGPLIEFVTGSVSNIIEADISDLKEYAFLKLVTPEDAMHVSEYLERLTNTTEVLFETFSLLYRPRLIDDVVAFPDEENPRIIVECLGAAVEDGVTLLLRKLYMVPAPTHNWNSSYYYSRMREHYDNSGYMSLSEAISSDPDTSDVPDWSPYL
ncbi:hypothetical protein COEREDRAFT_79053 [Coemansia reversa NRRL 1564]|uniref:PAS domain-containing protein n=1 Tax=Coemansia reversa (strain ATCC 12441 / NRRL 1564) TaxID=763665 RepID=A0A2G5BLA2_COERN|nr:hypothetical protein COEREDRAFT_79053 [Coemansia reversa NRRL 1564]|eukprot:PIA19788.1 hypothetical protein COEREDRAFT_79053 [Coemansia reversa NRRL 1564]